MPNSLAYKEVCKELKDSQLMLPGHKPSKTWFAGYPLMRIDHICVTEEFGVHAINTAHTALARMASDHLPIVVDVKLEKK